MHQSAWGAPGQRLGCPSDRHRTLMVQQSRAMASGTPRPMRRPRSSTPERPSAATVQLHGRQLGSAARPAEPARCSVDNQSVHAPHFAVSQQPEPTQHPARPVGKPELPGRLAPEEVARIVSERANRLFAMPVAEHPVLGRRGLPSQAAAAPDDWHECRRREIEAEARYQQELRAHVEASLDAALSTGAQHRSAERREQHKAALLHANSIQLVSSRHPEGAASAELTPRSYEAYETHWAVTRRTPPESEHWQVIYPVDHRSAKLGLPQRCPPEVRDEPAVRLTPRVHRPDADLGSVGGSFTPRLAPCERRETRDVWRAQREFSTSLSRPSAVSRGVGLDFEKPKRISLVERPRELPPIEVEISLAEFDDMDY